VDCYPGRSNVSLPAERPIHAVLDHHIVPATDNRPYYHDVRQYIGATSTIVTEYLTVANCPVASKLATALFYGIKTDTGDLGRDTSQEDLECYKWLFSKMDHGLLAKIENPDRDVGFFRTVHRAAEAMVAFDSFGYIPLGTVGSPDVVAEMADLYHGLEKIDTTICCGIFKKHIFFSIRAKQRDEAGNKAEAIAIAMGGGGGGHGKVGAGRFPFEKDTLTETMNRFVATFKKEFNIPNEPGVPLLEDELET
jgi:nanoRNase/pAp phosphatase (c-di-AMP/oligoRNAs hydrolase)